MKTKRILSVILALAMIIGTMSFSVFAEETTIPVNPDRGYVLYIYNADGSVGMSIDGSKSTEETFSLKSAIEDARVFVDNPFISGITPPATYKIILQEDFYEDESFEIGSDVTIEGNGHNIVLAEGVELTNNGATIIDANIVSLTPAPAHVAKVGDTYYDTLTEAMGKFNGRTVEVLCDVEEDIAGFYGVTLTTNVAGGVTIKDTNTGWVDFDDVTIDSGVTVDIPLPYSGDSENVIKGTLIAGDTYYHGYDAKTTIKDGGKVIVNGTTIIRYNETSDAGIYVYGDGDDSTVEFDCSYYIGSYSGTFYAKDANIKAGYYLLKNSYDNSSYADMALTLDNSSIEIVGTSDGQDSFIIDDQISITMTNGAAIEDVRDFNILTGADLALSVDSTSSISATYMNIAEDVPFEAAKNSDGTYGVGTLPNADVIDLGAITLDEYGVWSGSWPPADGTEPIDLHVAMEFIAKDTPEEAATNAFGGYTTDFFITIDGIEGDSFVADGCYLAGNYGSFGWIMIPIDGMTIEENKIYPVITTVGFDFSYENICTSVKDFKCGIYFSDDVRAANPDMTVKLELGLSENMEAAQSAEFITVDEPYTYAVEDFGYVAEIGDVKYPTLQAAVDAVTEGQTITMIATANLASPLVIAKGKNVTIDLNGKNINYSSDVQGEAMISNSGTLTINDETSTGAIVFTYTGEADSNYGKGNYTVDNRGSMTLNGGTIEIKAKDCEGKFPHALYAIQNYSGFDLTINDGRVYNANNIAVRTFGDGDLTVKDGEIEGLRAIWIQLPSNNTAVAPEVNITISGGTLTGTGIGESNNNKLAIYSYSYGNDMKNVTINISGGTFNGDIALTGGSNKTNIETVNVTGGTFNGKFGELYSYGDDAAAKEAITITGGTFATNYAEMYAANDGFVFEANSDGTFGAQEKWYTATDAGAYGDGNIGMMRWLFGLKVDGTVSASGIKYIKNSNIGADVSSNVADEVSGNAKAFYGDITNVPETANDTYYAVAYITIDGKTYWSKPIANTPNFEKIFADYNGGAN